MKTKAFDIGVFNRYLSSQATDDLNRFLEKMPQNAGHGVLIAAGIAWGIAAAFGLFTMMQAKQMTELRAKLQEASALKPVVPTITYASVADGDLKTFVDGIKPVYSGLDINTAGGKVTIQANDTVAYAEFREALGHIANGGLNWKLDPENICVGRECMSKALNATIAVQKVVIDKPAVASE